MRRALRSRVTERETDRLIAWSAELRRVHERLRRALRVTREDRTLFPAIAAARPDLGPVLRALEHDHSMIAHLLDGLRDSAARDASPQELDQHLEGIAAVMENHFRYEERQLLTVLESLEFDADPGEVLGPL